MNYEAFADQSRARVVVSKANKTHLKDLVAKDFQLTTIKFLTDDKSLLQFNDVLKIADIPKECYQWQIRPAVHWIVERYRATPKNKYKSNLTNDANDFVCESGALKGKKAANMRFICC